MTTGPEAARQQRGFALRLVEESRMDPATDAAIRRLLCECFPPDVPVFSKTRHWHGTAPAYSFVFEEGGVLSGHVGVVLRTVSAGGVRTGVAGIQNLAVAAPMRGSGLSRALMREAMAEAARRGVEFGLLFCVPGLERFYNSLGWVRRDVAAAMDDGLGKTVPIPSKNICMSLDLAARPFPAGDIDLEGRDW